MGDYRLPMKISSTYYFTEISTWSLSTLSTPPTTTTTTQKTSHPTPTTTTTTMHTTFKFLKMVFSKTSKNKISSSMIDFFNKAKVSLRHISSSSSSYPASQVADADEEGEIKNIIFVGDAPPRMDEEQIRMTSSEKWIEIEILNHPENNHLRRRRLIGLEEEEVVGVGEEGLCSKRILMGRRCRPINFYEEEEEEAAPPENDLPAFGPTTHLEKEDP
ncbi:hypothetical protein QJS04_geneDACA007169 [Acorus gramineus]|uniref:Uncharacterized protein n=1 Tax=Acorus gramineus TaxID=55184 RepID=A0AAV9BPU2_ACOGR|nr:hypothetical protein QJS04_geneDACA007169 [Acorus gramineus]